LHRLLPALLCCLSVARAAEPPPASTVPAGDDDELALQGCPVDPPPELPELPPADPDDPRIEVLTGRAEVDLNAGAVFSDDIIIRRGTGVLSAPGARYDQATGRFELEDGLSFRDPQAAVSGKRAQFDSQTNALAVESAEFQLFEVPARGAADRIEVKAGKELELTDVTYTTCARGQEDWLLRAGEIEIDRESGVGTARDARLEFKGVPILYTPWISYPVTNERKSGFLLPAIGRSETRGFEFQIPYYFNLAPNYDATLTPRFMAQRGLQLISEFRYLWPEHDGDAEAEYLPDDEGTSEDRYLLGLDHQSLLGAGWRATLNARTVSDTRYFEDLYGSSSATSQTHLEHVLDVEYFSDIWSVLARVQDFETLDESLTGEDKPYRRVPQIAASAYVPDGVLGIDWRLDGEFSVFERNAGPTGSRLHISPGIALPLDYRGFHLEPAAALEHTMYSIENPEPGESDGPSRTTPILSVDLATVLERGSPGRPGWLQTLEPRVQYVHIPFREQDDLPVFDTIEPDFNLVQLFRTNRFLGYDRLGDTDQLNIGLTSRLIDADNGTQYVTATIGQTRFFGTQEVTLPGGTPVDANSSDWLAELGLNFWDHWKMDLGWQWDSDASESERAQARLQYRRDGRRVVNLAYRYRRDFVEEIDVSAAWPITDRWSAVGRYDYSLFDQEPLESFVGLEYQNCCWGLRLVYRRYLASRTGEYDTAIAVQLILKGLTNVGDPADRLLERGILGYETD
jgi:LPS-assembly protein